MTNVPEFVTTKWHKMARVVVMHQRRLPTLVRRANKGNSFLQRYTNRLAMREASIWSVPLRAQMATFQGTLAVPSATCCSY